MTTSVSLSTRVSAELRERLLAQARARKVPLSELARDLLASGLDGAQAPDGGALVNEVECVFAHFGPEAGVRREIALLLARTAQRGGSAGISAGRELLDEIRIAEHLYDDEEDDDEVPL